MHYPGLKNFARSIGELPATVTSLVASKLKYKAVAAPHKILQISPSAIESKVSRASKRKVLGEIRDGDWDLRTVPIAETIKFRAIVQRFQQGVPWEETLLFKHYGQRLAKHGEVLGCRSIEELAARYRVKIDQLYMDLQRAGFQSPSAFAPVRACFCVYIGRDGEILIGADGNHRLAISKLLGIDSIPAKVLLRHTRWQEIREEIARNPLANHREHPDLIDIRKTC